MHQATCYMENSFYRLLSLRGSIYSLWLVIIEITIRVLLVSIHLSFCSHAPVDIYNIQIT
jgi:hypothetical protein